MLTFAELLKRWPSRSVIAADCGVPYGHVKQWARRDSVPSEHWQALVLSAAKNGISGVSAATLAEIAANRRAA